MSCIEYTDSEGKKGTYLVEEFSAGASPDVTKVKLFDATSVKSVTVELPVSYEKFQEICRTASVPSFRAVQPR